MNVANPLSLVPLVFVVAATISSNLGAGQTAASGNHFPPPLQLTGDQDHQRVMDLLHITSLRPGAEGDPKSPRAANYDESKAGPFSKLPDPLQLNHGG